MNFSARIFICVLFVFILSNACSDKEKTKTTEDAFVSYVDNSPSSTFFGKVVLKEFIENMDYKSLPKLNVLISKEVSTISKGLDLNEPIYFAVDSLLQKDGSPSGIYVFLKVKNKDSLADKLSSMGYLIEPSEKNLNVMGKHLSGQISNNFAVLHLSKYASKNTINQAIQKTALPVNSNIKSIIKRKSAFSLHVHLEHIQQIIDNVLIERAASKKNELIALYKNSFISMDFNLKKETLIGEIKFDFNSSLKKRLFFKQNAQLNLANVAKNDFVSGIGLSIDPLKTDLFINDFYPSLLMELSKNNLSLQLALMSLGDRPISNLISGEVGFAYHNASSPTCSIELGNKASEIKKLGASYLPYLNVSGLHFEGNLLSNTSLTKNTSFEYFKKSNDGLFIVYDSKNDEKIRTLTDNTKFLDAISTILFTLNNEGGKIIIKGKNPNQKLLHQIASMYLSNIIERIKIQ